MKLFYSTILCFSLLFCVNSYAEDRHWITGPGNNTLIETNYGTATVPLSWFDANKWFLSNNSTAASPPVDGESVAHANSCCNPEPFITIDNSGNGVLLPDSDIRFDAKTNIFDSSAGDLSDVDGNSYNFTAVDDSLTASTIAFNGAGGAAVDIYVPVVANTLTSNRHGARLFAPIRVDTILANSNHQDKWEINSSPSKKIERIELNENRGTDGGTIDGFFSVNADTEVTTLDQVWQRLRVGTGATLNVETMNYSDYTSKEADNNINPIELDGEMVVSCLNVIDMATDTDGLLAKGTYGRVGNAQVDNQVDWITAGNGVLNVTKSTGCGEEQCYTVKTANGKIVTYCL